jgi:hypothetical protein
MTPAGHGEAVVSLLTVSNQSNDDQAATIIELFS